MLDSSDMRSYCTAQLCILLRLLAGTHVLNLCYAMWCGVTWFGFFLCSVMMKVLGENSE